MNLLNLGAFFQAALPKMGQPWDLVQMKNGNYRAYNKFPLKEGDTLHGVVDFSVTIGVEEQVKLNVLDVGIGAKEGNSQKSYYLNRKHDAKSKIIDFLLEDYDVKSSLKHEDPSEWVINEEEDDG